MAKSNKSNMSVEESAPSFVNRVVKQGNSLCVRIPNFLVKETKLNVGNEVYVWLHKVDYNKYQKNYEEGFIETIDKIPELKKLSTAKKKMFTTLCFDLNRRGHDSNTEKQKKKMQKIALEYKKELGNKLYAEFEKFGNLVNRKVNITEKDGSIVIKKGFR
jgi:hypothetical protein